MMWPYQFVDLTEQQKDRRRELLDRHALIAQISPLAPLLVVQIVYFISQMNRKRDSQKNLEVPSSPYLKGQSFASPQTWTIRLRKLAWLMGNDVVVFGETLGTKGQVLSALIWTVWLLCLSIAYTGNDYLHLTKRFGIIGATQLPWHYLLSVKTPWSPLQILTRKTHESLIAYHQLLGRTIIFLLYLHATFYLNFYIQKGLFASKLQEGYVLCGVFGIISFAVIGSTALDPVRKWNYRVFHAVHIVLATALLPVLFFHVSHIRVYLYEVAIIHFGNVILRSLNSAKTTAHIKSLSANLLEISIPTSSKNRHFNTAQHAYMSLAGHPASRTIRSNPFTLASVPSYDDGNLKFYARVLNGNTTQLAAHAKYHQQQEIALEGPYGTKSHPDELLRHDRVLFVAGGIGATFIVPLYRQLLADMSPSAGSSRRQKVEFIWVVRRAEETMWAVPKLEKEAQGFAERCKVFVTGSGASHDHINGSPDSSLWQDSDTNGTSEAIELEERKDLLSHESEHQISSSMRPFSTGRPNLRRIVEETFSHRSQERVAVFVCGPKSLSGALRKEVGKVVMREGREVWFWEEVYGM